MQEQLPGVKYGIGAEKAGVRKNQAQEPRSERPDKKHALWHDILKIEHYKMTIIMAIKAARDYHRSQYS
jgi:hypothetical protein